MLAEGASSLAGPLAALVYSRREGDHHVVYLDAGFDTPRDPDQQANASTRLRGKAVLVPGAPAGLFALWERYGSMRFAELVEPAIALAENGVPVTNLMASFIRWRKRTLRSTEYGRRTFFEGGKRLRPGQLLRQPELADFLRGYARDGASYVYRGDWAQQFIRAVSAEGGRLTLEDLASYAVQWHQPRVATYRDYVLHASSGASYGGLWVLMALKTLEHASLDPNHPYWDDAGQLEMMIRIARQVWSEPALLDIEMLQDPDVAQSLLQSTHTAHMWERVQSKARAFPMRVGEPHSYQVITQDRHGNVVNGTTTIEAEPWGDGIFVHGLALSAGGRIPWGTKPGKRRLTAFTMVLGHQGDELRCALGTISNSLVESAFQLLVQLIDYRLPPLHAVSTPRFGTFPSAAMPRKLSLRLDCNMCDPRVAAPIARQLKKAGIKIVQRAPTDTGLGALLWNERDQTQGLTLPVPHLQRPFESD